MSAEKEVVNFWLNGKGYFTVNNLKSSGRDIGILAFKFDKAISIMHVEVACSISRLSEQNYLIERIINEKFNDDNIKTAIMNYAKNMGADLEIKNAIVLNSLPEDNKNTTKKIKEENIIILKFEDMLADVMKELKTSYFRNDTLRAMQLIKFLLIQNPKRFVDVLYESLGQQKMREFLAELLNRDEIIKEFRKTNEERLALILKQAMIKPEKLAEMLENDILNRKTRKTFVASLMEQDGMKKYKKRAKLKKEMPLNKFFG